MDDNGCREHGVVEGAGSLENEEEEEP